MNNIKSMDEKDKQLLLIELCARVRNGVMVSFNGCGGSPRQLTSYDNHYTEFFCAGSFTGLKLEEIKPHLRSMEDMTEEEMDEVEKILGNENIFDFMANGDIVLRKGCFNQKQLVELHDFLCSIHVDDCGLIDKGLAIKVTKENNPYERRD